jgi:phosphoribosylcarboxyaminoimidazole (NCAIR) mutase
VQHAFFDSATRVVIIDVPFYNANLGQFISLTFIVDMPPGAGLIKYSVSNTLPFHSASVARCTASARCA